MCDCISYNRPEPRQKTRSVFLNPMEYFSYDSIARKVPVDACIADDIRRLWSAGIETGGCCCGHNERKKSVAIKSSCDAEKAREILGDDWEIVAWQLKELAPSAEETLRQQLANSEARVAELEADNAHQRERRNAARDCIQKMKAEALRKQAEAVDEAREHMIRDAARGTGMNVDDANAWLKVKVQWLRDEAERAGGEK